MNGNEVTNSGVYKIKLSAPVFGYGSLIWRPDFEYERREVACLRGWRRRFWQASTDHRGVPGAPGRVVTLVPEADAVCLGVLYYVPEIHRERVSSDLDYREKNGYDKLSVGVELEDGEQIQAITYIASEDNEHFLGPAPLEAIAAQVRTARGPSGHNAEYVLELAQALRELGAEHDEVFELEQLLTEQVV